MHLLIFSPSVDVRLLGSNALADKHLETLRMSHVNWYHSSQWSAPLALSFFLRGIVKVSWTLIIYLTSLKKQKQSWFSRPITEM